MIKFLSVHHEPGLGSAIGQKDCVRPVGYCYRRKIYKLELFPPFSRYRLSFITNPALTKSLIARFTVLRDNFISRQIVLIAGKHEFSLLHRWYKYRYTAAALGGRSDRYSFTKLSFFAVMDANAPPFHIFYRHWRLLQRTAPTARISGRQPFCAKRIFSFTVFNFFN